MHHDLDLIRTGLADRHGTDLGWRCEELPASVEIWTTTDNRYAVIAPSADRRRVLIGLRAELDEAARLGEGYARDLG